ncbi:amylo-alpha-1,6-glucosidase [Catalinimonas niigatensis]|uniref:amylo-alpha-1,6-glucosidase n=1 Tax=Catalinimonas niigatensis TaxID=1397264 RepID=UPI002666C0B2|nr:trehalase family glycosidase [Catalinimonas niigatensis]WPP50171.1 trehalase family glycosidase [Catalinimonas niigatensis]
MNPIVEVDLNVLFEEAKNVLLNNRIGKFTKPAPALYPHQWNWDAGFISIGYAYFDMEQAESELRYLFSGQWANGMLPHIIFNPDGDGQYFPGISFWETWRSFDAPEQVNTSGISNPAVHGFVLQRMYEIAEDKDRALDFVQEMFPKIKALHAYFYSERDPYHEGLVYIRHPWESGNDNSPTWDAPLERIDFSKVKVPPFTRKDLNTSHADHRPTNRDYDRYIYLIDVFRKGDYKEDKIFSTTPFAVQDPLFNTILIKSNQAMIDMGRLIGEDIAIFKDWNVKSVAAMNDKLWNEQTGMYDAYDLINEERIEMEASSGLMPLFANVPSEKQAKIIVKNLMGPKFHQHHDQSYYLCPSFTPLSSKFDPKKYWRGPVWINMNWMLYQGLKRYGFRNEATHIKEDSLKLLSYYGFYEYFDPRKNLPQEKAQGYGSPQFSWSAALCLDWLSSDL